MININKRFNIRHVQKICFILTLEVNSFKVKRAHTYIYICLMLCRN